MWSSVAYNTEQNGVKVTSLRDKCVLVIKYKYITCSVNDIIILVHTKKR